MRGKDICEKTQSITKLVGSLIYKYNNIDEKQQKFNQFWSEKEEDMKITGRPDK